MDGRVDTDAGWATWPNVVTLVRLAALPLYVWILATTEHRALAAWLLAVLGATDWVDGYLARRLTQTSTVGKILDPVADRLLVATSVISVAAVGGVPWWFATATLAREIVVSALTLILAALGASRIDVLWWGKVSTFALMTAYPLFLLTSSPSPGSAMGVLRAASWAIGIFGLSLAWIVLLGYVRPALRALSAGRAGRRLK